MSAVTLYDLAAGVFVDHKRGPLPEIHAVSWKADTFGARLAACGRLGRFVPAGHDGDWAQFPKGDAATTAIAPPGASAASCRRRSARAPRSRTAPADA